MMLWIHISCLGTWLVRAWLVVPITIQGMISGLGDLKHWALGLSGKLPRYRSWLKTYITV